MFLTNKKICAIAPSGLINREKFKEVVSYLEKYDNHVSFSGQVYEKYRNMAGKDELRLKSLIEALESDSDYVWAIRGGFGALRILNEIPSNLKIKNKLLLIGYSDITAFQLYLYKLYGLKSISSHMLQVDLPFEKNDSTKHFISLLENKKTELILDRDVSYKNPAKTSGIILGGCLSIISRMLGTKHLPDFRDKILFLEDVNEELYKIDGYLAHLKNAGILNKLRGIIFGKFMLNNGDEIKEVDIKDLLEEYFSEYTYPIISNLSFGHIPNMIAMPIGYTCTMKKEKLVFVND